MTPREKLRKQLEQSKRDLESLPAWIRETPPAFESAEIQRRADLGEPGLSPGGHATRILATVVNKLRLEALDVGAPVVYLEVPLDDLAKQIPWAQPEQDRISIDEARIAIQNESVLWAEVRCEGSLVSFSVPRPDSPFQETSE